MGCNNVNQLHKHVFSSNTVLGTGSATTSQVLSIIFCYSWHDPTQYLKVSDNMLFTDTLIMCCYIICTKSHRFQSPEPLSRVISGGMSQKRWKCCYKLWSIPLFLSFPFIFIKISSISTTRYPVISLWSWDYKGYLLLHWPNINLVHNNQSLCSTNAHQFHPCCNVTLCVELNGI